MFQNDPSDHYFENRVEARSRLGGWRTAQGEHVSLPAVSLSGMNPLHKLKEGAISFENIFDEAVIIINSIKSQPLGTRLFKHTFWQNWKNTTCCNKMTILRKYTSVIELWAKQATFSWYTFFFFLHEGITKTNYGYSDLGICTPYFENGRSKSVTARNTTVSICCQ